MSAKIIDSFFTLAGPSEHEIKIKGSRFIARGFPLKNELDAQKILEKIRKEEYSATHHCYAYTYGINDVKFKYSDDGEPSGTAGQPIFQSITGRDLRNVIVVVIRYFGGTKLGTGGLTRAYAGAASEMLDKAGVVERLICDRLEFSIAFKYYDRLMRIINAEHFEIINQEFADEVIMKLKIRKSKTSDFESHLIELTGGRVKIDKNG
ncbi:MAG: YigZ family protein [Candidatus Zixiibacteriota bacterium]